MEIFIARQPILNRREQVVGYELLYRDGPENVFPKNMDGSVATAKILNNTHFNTGLATFTQGKTALINFTQQGLIDKLPQLLPVKQVIIEILETVEPNDHTYEACRTLFKEGYRLALDDFVYNDQWLRFLPLIKMIKIDVSKTPLNEVGPLIASVKQHKVTNVRRIKFLAERVEEREEFEQAVEMGFDYFQGYFFARPTMVKSKDLSPQHALLLAIYHEAMKPDINVDKLEPLFKQDPGITYKLLTYLNSGAFQLKKNIESIKGAIVYMGQDKMRRFIAVMVTAELKGDKSNLLVENSILRARFCELLAQRCAPALQQSAFFMGLLSLLDALLDRPMAQILKNISVACEIVEALVFDDAESLSEQGEMLKAIMDLVKIHETGSWRGMQRCCAKLRLDEQEIPRIHQDTLQWVSSFIGTAGINSEAGAKKGL